MGFRHWHAEWSGLIECARYFSRCLDGWILRFSDVFEICKVGLSFMGCGVMGGFFRLGCCGGCCVGVMVRGLDDDDVVVFAVVVY